MQLLSPTLIALQSCRRPSTHSQYWVHIARGLVHNAHCRRSSTWRMLWNIWPRVSEYVT